jgi:hypothetical protein
MPRVGFEPTSPVFERAKTVHALERAATVVGRTLYYRNVPRRNFRLQILEVKWRTEEDDAMSPPLGFATSHSGRSGDCS